MATQTAYNPSSPAARISKAITARNSGLTPNRRTQAMVTQSGLLVIARDFVAGQMAVSLSVQALGLAAGALGTYTVELRSAAPTTGRRPRITKKFTA